MAKGRKTIDAARDSGSGQFITRKEADKHPDTSQKIRLPKPGRGDSKGEPDNK